MSFWKMIDEGHKHPAKSDPRRPDEAYWGTLPRACKLCKNLETTDPPNSLKKAGVKPCRFCTAFEKACYLAIEICKKVKHPIGFKVTK